ncbi:putative membrane protein YecN with MAPEG domain [Sphingomonas sp. BE123]|uniref:MAPEG family protein n=1 Tax=Sphingomonas sp. BE123 TaxID=2817842 RepID=UPI002865B5A4|nr:MAPEG family protein [Sphingomonas sp. BE123]MDR6852591.1 putative membrane protein YecN with MAPEG domain [Sphingomonas sp. BE123]
MDAIILPVTLAAAAACALLNAWLTYRVGQVRRAEKILVGDGGSTRLTARMRAQLNFVEHAPFVLILLGLIELAVGTETWLWVAAALFVAGRILHAFGMDGWMPGRAIGIVVTLLVTVGLAGYAAAIPYLAFEESQTIELVDVAS